MAEGACQGGIESRVRWQPQRKCKKSQFELTPHRCSVDQPRHVLRAAERLQVGTMDREGPKGIWVDQIRGYCSCESETRVVPGKMERSVDV